MNTHKNPELVALTRDIPGMGLHKGQVGKVERLAYQQVYQVSFSLGPDREMSIFVEKKCLLALDMDSFEKSDSIKSEGGA